jgi:hypothetical protein
VDRPSKIAKTNDTFGDFLDSMSNVNIESAASSSSEAEKEAPPAAVESTPLTLTNVLGYLGEHDGQSIPELARGLRSPILQTAEMIGKLKDSGVLTVDGKPGSERVTLTATGRNLSAVR